jgi:hypothetical protein
MLIEQTMISIPVFDIAAGMGRDETALKAIAGIRFDADRENPHAAGALTGRTVSRHPRASAPLRP